MLSKTKVKYIQSLYQKKNRDAEKLFIAEGPKIINELLAAGAADITEVFALEGWLAQHLALQGRCTAVTEEELKKISALATPHTVLAVVRQAPAGPLPDAAQQLVVALDGIQDPGNLGTIIRICDWFGVKHVVCSPDTADRYNPKTVQATMASITRVAVHYTPLGDYLQQQRAAGIYAAVLHGQPLAQAGTVTKGVLLIGNEAKGIRAEVLPLVTHTVSIPGRGGAESLNAAVATGIILSHLMTE
jgi:RNA methyltransferase, TrmH family